MAQAVSHFPWKQGVGGSGPVRCNRVKSGLKSNRSQPSRQFESSIKLQHENGNSKICNNQTAQVQIDPFTKLELQNPSHGFLVRNKTSRSPDFEALKLGKGPPGCGMTLSSDLTHSLCFKGSTGPFLFI